MLAGLPVVKIAVAGPAVAESVRSDTVALAFDPSGRALLKATVDAVHRSRDGGRHWAAVELPPVPGATAITSIAVYTGRKSALYVAGVGFGVLRSNDGGRNWTERNDGLPGTDVAALAAHADRPATLYAYVRGRGIFRSEDGGQHWRLMDAGPRGGITRLVHSNMPGSMQSGWLFAATPHGVRRAMDCFCGWRDAGGLGRPVSAVAFDIRQPAHVYAAGDAELFFSSDGGEKWSHVNGPEAVIQSLAVTPDGVIYAAGAGGRLFRRGTTATSWQRTDA